MRRSGRKHGRGAVSSPKPRFVRAEAVPEDDGWGSLELESPEAIERVVTEVRSERARSIISRNDSPDIAYSATINPYRGCEHGCIYCYARPTHAYLDLSPGLDFETRLAAKDNAPEVLVDTLRKRSYRPHPVTIGANTDPYQPVERERQITRRLLEVMLESQHPVTVITKSSLVVRDFDVLSALAAKGLFQLRVSVTSLNSALSTRMEPRAASPARRLEVIRMARDAGIPVGAMLAPMIPAINDHELESLMAAVAEAGAQAASYVLLRLPLELGDMFEAWLEEHFPDRKDRVLGLIRDTRGGELYRADFGVRMRGQGAVAELLARRFEIAARRHGLQRELPAFATGTFRAPGRPGDQLSLL